MAELTRTLAAIADLSVAADALIAKAGTGISQADVDAADQAAADAITAVTDKLNTASA